MPFYRVYTLDKSNRITDRLEFDASDDASAIEFSRHGQPGQHLELWESTRLVSALAPVPSGVDMGTTSAPAE